VDKHIVRSRSSYYCYQILGVLQEVNMQMIDTVRPTPAAWRRGCAETKEVDEMRALERGYRRMRARNG
jgi:hypothetical protein